MEMLEAFARAHSLSAEERADLDQAVKAAARSFEEYNRARLARGEAPSTNPQTQLCFVASNCQSPSLGKLVLSWAASLAASAALPPN